jgi:cob(I)alamin adenosyltransferase
VVRLTKIYTRAGDTGDTRLVGGPKVPKDSVRIEAYGTIDETNCIIGIAQTELARSTMSAEPKARLDAWLQNVQNDLFNLGSDLATRYEDRWEGQPLITESDVRSLETLMDDLNTHLPALDSFVLPGGNPITAHLHLARTVCRRAERIIVSLGRDEKTGEYVLPYVNRLSDALFVWSRWVAHQLGEPENLWEPNS